MGGQPAPAVPLLSQLNQRIDSKVQREREAATRPVYHVQADKDPNVGRPHADPPAMTEAVAVKQTPSRPSVAKQTEISESVASVISTPESSLVSSGPVLQMRVSSAQKGVRSTEEQAAKARRKEEQEKSLKGKSWKKRAAGRAAEEAEQAAAQRDSVEAAQTSGEDNSGPSSFVPSAWREVTQPGAPATEDSSLGDMFAFGAAPGGRPVRTEAILQLRVLDRSSLTDVLWLQTTPGARKTRGRGGAFGRLEQQKVSQANILRLEHDAYRGALSNAGHVSTFAVDLRETPPSPKAGDLPGSQAASGVAVVAKPARLNVMGENIPHDRVVPCELWICSYCDRPAGV